MRSMACVMVAVAGSLFGAAPVRSADAPAIVIPGKPGVPVIINGYDASYAVVEGDWGLDRPGHVPPTIVPGPYLFVPVPGYYSGYYPAYGRRPGYGRLEIEPPPNRRLPPLAERYYRSWTSQSDPLPVDLEPPPGQPPVIVAPEINVRDQRSRRHR
jgi:hypothetical protein